MLDAICILDNDNPTTYSIFEFKGLPEAELDRLRYALICPECKQKAYFRRASTDGRQACFGSRYHDLDCPEFNPSARKAEEERQFSEVELIVHEADSLVIDFSKITVSIKDNKTVAKDAQAAKIKKTTKAKQLDIPAEPDDTIKANKQNLAKLLTSLLRGSTLATSDLWIYTSETHKWRAKNLFVNIADAQPTDNGAPRMYWGTISHADKTLNWLNPAEDRGVGLPISRYRDLLLERFSIENSRDVEGSGFILFGKCILSKDKKRRYIQLWGNDLQYFYLSKAVDD